jgi:hypothetical protein
MATTSGKMTPGTIPLWPTTGQLMGLGKGATYAAAHAGHIPVLRMGGHKLRVIRPKLCALLGVGDEDLTRMIAELEASNRPPAGTEAA